jgi:hypothetical protein
MGVFVDQISEIYDPEDLTSFSWSDAQAARDTMSVYLHIKAIFLDGAVLKKVKALTTLCLSCSARSEAKVLRAPIWGSLGSVCRMERREVTSGTITPMPEHNDAANPLHP